MEELINDDRRALGQIKNGIYRKRNRHRSGTKVRPLDLNLTNLKVELRHKRRAFFGQPCRLVGSDTLIAGHVTTQGDARARAAAEAARVD